MTIEFRTCRFCQQSADSGGMVKYEVRHYAHHACYLNAGKKLDDLHAWQVRQFPYKLLKAHSLLDDAQRIIDAEDDR